MRIIYLFVFAFIAFEVNAASPHSQLDSLPSWKQFRKMKKTELIELYKKDAVAVDIIMKSGKRENRLLLVAGGLSIFSILIFVLADTATFSGAALSNLFFILLLGIIFITAAALALTLIIKYFTGKKRRLYKQLKTYLNNK